MEINKNFIDEAIAAYNAQPEVAALYSQVKSDWENRLYHNATLKLQQLIDRPELKGSQELIQLYDNFIVQLQSKMNQLTLAKIGVEVSRAYTDPVAAINFLERLLGKINTKEGGPEPGLLLRAILIQLKLRQGKQDECKQLLEEAQTTLEGITGVDSAVYSNFYRAQAEYWKLRGLPAQYYKAALQYLSYTPLETVSDSDKIQLAYDVGLAALIGDETYNFGDLVAHPIMNSLVGTENEWLAQMLQVFNRGNVDEYESLVAKYGTQLASVPALVQRTELLKEKISILCLMELVFNRHSADRVVPFSEIKNTTKLFQELDLEVLVMKALALKLIKGYIDEVAQHVVVTWVQPRVLGLDQIGRMHERLGTWIVKVNETLIDMENGTPDLFS